jgi:hypothetical protein
MQNLCGGSGYGNCQAKINIATRLKSSRHCYTAASKPLINLGHDADLLPRLASDGLDLRHEFELVKRILHLVVLQEISHRYIKDATESPEINYGALLDLSGKPVEIIVVVSRA